MGILNALFGSALGGAEMVEAAKAYEWQQANQACIVDVREPSETKSGMVKGAVNFPVAQVVGGSAEWMEFFKNKCQGKKLVVYCASGGRSGAAASHLKSQFKDQNIEVYNMGGFKNWAGAGLPTQ